jgi:hypothetical protein
VYEADRIAKAKPQPPSREEIARREREAKLASLRVLFSRILSMAAQLGPALEKMGCPDVELIEVFSGFLGRRKERGAWLVAKLKVGTPSDRDLVSGVDCDTTYWLLPEGRIAQGPRVLSLNGMDRTIGDSAPEVARGLARLAQRNGISLRGTPSVYEAN